MQESPTPPPEPNWIDEHPKARWLATSRTTGAAAVGFIVLVVVLVAVVLVRSEDSGDTTRAAAPSSTAAPSSVPATPGAAGGFGPSIADPYGREIAVPNNEQGQVLPQTDPGNRPAFAKDVPVPAPAGIMWQRIGATVAPFSTSDGPTRIDGRLAYGFARTPQGAALAGWQIMARALRSADDLREIYDLQTVADPGKKQAAMDQLAAAGKSDYRISDALFFPEAFQITSYTDSFAVVRYATPSENGTWVAEQRSLAWDNGDWKIRDTTSAPQPRLSSLAGVDPMVIKARPIFRLALTVAAVLGVLLLTTAPAYAQETDPPAGDSADSQSLIESCDLLPEWAQNIQVLPGASAENFCKAGAVVADPGAAVGEAVDWAASGAVGEAAEAFLEGFGQAVNLMFTWWLDIPLPDLANPESVGVFHSYFYWINASLVAVSITVAAVRLAAANASARAERATDTAKILVRTVFATATFAPLLIVTHAGAVKFGKWIVEDAAGGNVADVLGTMFDLSQVSSLLSAGLVMVFALLGIVGALVQAVFVVVQYAMLILVVGFLPTAAAGSGTPTGEQAFKKMIGFALATVLFPILSAGVYALALWSAGGDDAMSKLCGMALLALSCLCLPVLLRLIVPAVAASGGASGAAALGGVAVATGAVAGMAMKAGSAGAAAAGGRSGAVIGGQSPDRATGAMTNPPTTSAGQGGGGRSGAAGSPAGAAGAVSGAQSAPGKSGATSGATAPGAASAAKTGAAAVAAVMKGAEKATGAAAGDSDQGGSRGGRTP